MAEQKYDFHFQLLGHPTLLFDGSEFQRYTDVYFSIPSEGINDRTGFLLLIPGFGGHAQSNVYKKMRRVFADKYNLVTIQCDYLGSEFMQTLKSEDLQRVIASLSPEQLSGGNAIRIQVRLDETRNNYADLGAIQAIDCLSAVLATKSVLDDNGYRLNWGRGIAYGHSHGAYLAHLCNLFAPGLFHLIIDNSAWLFPVYLDSPRYVNHRVGDKTVRLYYEYLVRRLGVPDRQLYELPFLYGVLGTHAHLVIYQGIHDNLVSHHDKAAFARQVGRSHFHLITESEVNGEAFRSTGHGLNSDHLKLFYHAYGSADWDFPNHHDLNLTEVRFRTDDAEYVIRYEHGLPIFTLS